jgi:hypothetical protein
VVQEGCSNPKPAQRFQKRSVPALRGNAGPFRSRRAASAAAAQNATSRRRLYGSEQTANFCYCGAPGWKI